MFVIKREIVVLGRLIHKLRTEILIRVFWIAVVFGVFKFMKISPVKRNSEHVGHYRAACIKSSRVAIAYVFVLRDIVVTVYIGARFIRKALGDDVYHAAHSVGTV